jgi:hypothetical protein
MGVKAHMDTYFTLICECLIVSMSRTGLRPIKSPIKRVPGVLSRR